MAMHMSTKPVSCGLGRASAPSVRLAVPARTRIIARATVNKEKVLADVQGIIATQLGADLGKVTADAKFVDLGADSLDTVEIMMALEEKFEITLDEDGAEKITTVQEAADLISAQIASK